jgi:ABC-type multidrug transport system fused ATPase/permease subunit
MTYILQLPSLFGAFVQIRAVFESDLISLERMTTYEKNKVEGELLDQSLCSRIEPPLTWPAQGGVVFRAFSTRHGENLPLCLKSINLEIKAGEKIGVIGRTGAGKSTLALSLLRVSEAAEGAILIDGVDIANVEIDVLRSRLAIILHKCPAFRGSLRQNLDPMGEYCDADLERVIRDSLFLTKRYDTSASMLDMEIEGDG